MLKALTISFICLMCLGCSHIEFDWSNNNLEESMEDDKFEQILDEAERETDKKYGIK